MANFVKTNERIVKSTEESLLILPVDPPFSRLELLRLPLNINVCYFNSFIYFKGRFVRVRLVLERLTQQNGTFYIHGKV